MAAEKRVPHVLKFMPAKRSQTFVSVKFSYSVANPSGTKHFNLMTPNRKHISEAAVKGHKKGMV